jgi:hypothetical protein
LRPGAAPGNAGSLSKFCLNRRFQVQSAEPVDLSRQPTIPFANLWK